MGLAVSTAAPFDSTWTPGIAFGGNSVGMTLTSSGYYTRVGNIVMCSGIVTLTAKGSSTGIATITGLPFTVFNNNAAYSGASIFAANISGVTGAMTGYGVINTTTINIANGAGASLTDANFTATTQIVVSISYRAV